MRKFFSLFVLLSLVTSLYSCQPMLGGCYNIQMGLGAYVNNQFFNPSTLTNVGGYVTPRLAWWNKRWHTGLEANFGIAKVKGDSTKALYFFENDKHTNSGIINASIFGGVNLGTLQSPIFLDMLLFTHFNIYDQRTRSIENGYLYTGMQLSHIVYMSDFWNLEWGLGYGYMLLGFYDINMSANIPYPYTIPTRVQSQPNHLLKAYTTLTMGRTYYMRLNIMYFTPQDSKSFALYSDNMKFSHKGDIMVGLEFGWNLKY